MSKQIFISEDEAYALTKKEQVSILKARNIKPYFKDKEADLVKKILDSNPIKEEEKVIDEEKLIKKEISDVKCLKCGSDMVKTGGGHSGTDFECIKCKFKLTKIV